MILNNCKDWIEIISQLILSIGVILTFFTIRITRKNNFLIIIEKCTKEYRKHARRYKKLLNKEEHNSDENKEELCLDLLGLFNKQLYYIRKGYTPKLITREWLSTINLFLNETCYTNLYPITILSQHKKDFNRILWFSEIKDSIDKGAKKHKCKTKQENRFKRKMLRLYYQNIKYKSPLFNILYYKMLFRFPINHR